MATLRSPTGRAVKIASVHVVRLSKNRILTVQWASNSLLPFRCMLYPCFKQCCGHCTFHYIFNMQSMFSSAGCFVLFCGVVLFACCLFCFCVCCFLTGVCGGWGVAGGGGVRGEGKVLEMKLEVSKGNKASFFVLQDNSNNNNETKKKKKWKLPERLLLRSTKRFKMGNVTDRRKDE